MSGYEGWMSRVTGRSRKVLARTTAAVVLAGLAWAGLNAASTAPAPAAAGAPAVMPAPSLAAPGSYADVVGRVSPSVVTIRTEGRREAQPTAMIPEQFRRFFGDEGPAAPREHRQRGLGSGVVVSTDGYILTNHHVVDSAEVIKVELNDGRMVTAKLVGSDQPSDLAVLKIDEKGLPPLPLGDSDGVRVGDVVLAVGNPLGVGQTVTMGIVSAKGRSTEGGDGGYQDFLQTDAPINQGNSGGPLVSARGELVGINSQILSPSGGNIGIGFAIPANMARNVMDQLVKTGTVQRSQLGVAVQPVTSEMAQSLRLPDVRGAIVASVKSGSAAERAGLKRGDVITAFQGTTIHDSNNLRNRVAEMTPGTEAKLTIVRDGQEKTLTVRLDQAEGRRSASRESRGESDDALGLRVEPVTPAVADRLGIEGGTKGVVATEVNPDGRAADAGIQEGDVIEQVNRRAVSSAGDLRAALQESGDRPALVLLNRRGTPLFITVPVAPRS